MIQSILIRGLLEFIVYNFYVILLYRMNIQNRKYKNNELNIDINCYVDEKNQIWFKAKEITLILDYKNSRKAILDHVHQDDKKLIDFKIKTFSRGNKMLPLAETFEKVYRCYFINESGFYSLILSSKQPKAKEFKHWVTSKVLPSIRKYGYYDSKTKRLSIDT